MNSILTTNTMDMDESQYQDFLTHSVTATQKIAIPVSGNYFLRLGVHNLLNDRMGALEVAVDQVRREVTGQVAQTY